MESCSMQLLMVTVLQANFKLVEDFDIGIWDGFGGSLTI